MRNPAVTTDRAPRLHQSTIFEQIDRWSRAERGPSPERIAFRVFACVLALSGFGLVMQASHASTMVAPGGLAGALLQPLGIRAGGIFVLLLAARIGPQRLRRFVPHLTLLAGALLLAVFVPGIGLVINGARRWIEIPVIHMSFQPSELARLAIVLWVADRCARLGPRVRGFQSGVLPILGVGLFGFFLILIEPDLGGGLLFLLCFLCTLWVGGARPLHMIGSMLVLGGGAFAFALSRPYVRARISTWFGHSTNEQVQGALEGMASGDVLGVGLGHGAFRNAVPYLDSDYAFALIGEELGLFGMACVLGLYAVFTWNALRLVQCLRDPFVALATFGLLISVACQAMLHVQVVTGLAPPKGMVLPFISSGGSSILVSYLAVGLALGAAFPRRNAQGARVT